MNYITTRKIKVVGCLNCPYLFKQELPDNKYIYKCHHPSFQLGSPQIPFKFVEDLGAEMDEPTMFPTSSFPEWCLLEIESVVCCCNPVN